MKQRTQAATLAVGTEVTDGQIIDRNSAWISARLVHAGVQVIEHRAVADDHAAIRRALVELSQRVDLLFVTGGLGPTSDDFTRDLLSEVYGRPLEYDEASWRHIEARLSERGIQPKEIQRQQCYFPKDARIHLNPAGTANAFSITADVPTDSVFHKVTVYALPGPPTEIAAVWEHNLASEMESLMAPSEREHLTIFRCLGKGESDIAELTEAALAGSGLRVGYRAHLPYVEVKVWYSSQADTTLRRVEDALSPWLVNRDDEDATDAILTLASSGASLLVADHATGGLLQERLLAKIRERKLSEKVTGLVMRTAWSTAPSAHDQATGFENLLQIAPSLSDTSWQVTWRLSGKSGILEVSPTFNYKIRTDRGRRYITEKALLIFTGATKF